MNGWIELLRSAPRRDLKPDGPSSTTPANFPAAYFPAFRRPGELPALKVAGSGALLPAGLGSLLGAFLGSSIQPVMLGSRALSTSMRIALEYCRYDSGLRYALPTLPQS